MSNKRRDETRSNEHQPRGAPFHVTPHVYWNPLFEAADRACHLRRYVGTKDLKRQVIRDSLGRRILEALRDLLGEVVHGDTPTLKYDWDAHEELKDSMNIFVEMGRLLRAIPVEDGLKNVCLRDSGKGHNERSLIEASIEDFDALSSAIDKILSESRQRDGEESWH